MTALRRSNEICFTQASERVVNRLEPARFARSGQSELALAGGRDGREEEPDFATRLKASWEVYQGQKKVQETATPERERETSQEFAARLRQAAAGIDPDDLANRAAELREGRETEERHQAQKVAREQEPTRQKEIEREADSIAERDRGLSYGI
jgi:hypothetical protein